MADLREVEQAILRYYAGPKNDPWGPTGRPTGGNLHIVLDDQNWERGHVEFCRGEALADGDAEGVALADMLLALTDEERRSVV